jgi:hypothetical protein
MSIRVEHHRPVQAYQWLSGFPTTYFLNGLLTFSQKPGGTAPHARVHRMELSGADGDAGAFYGKPLPMGKGVNLNTPLFFGGFLYNPVVTGGSFEARDVLLNRAITGFHTLRTEDSSITVTNAVITEAVTGLGAVLFEQVRHPLRREHRPCLAIRYRPVAAGHAGPRGLGAIAAVALRRGAQRRASDASHARTLGGNHGRRRFLGEP